MENLYHIQKKKNHDSKVSTWSYYRLMKFIEYKAKIEGIQVKLINPYFTSQRCPNCQSLNKPNNRTYSCVCGYNQHRDIVGATNIMMA